MTAAQPSPQQALEMVRADARRVIAGREGLLDPLRAKNLYIAGGTGFLGTWLLELLKVLNEDHAFGTRVTVFSRNSSPFREKRPHLANATWLRFEDGDIRFLADLPHDTHFVIHAAALTDRRLFSSQPTLVAETNSLGTARILKACLLLENLEKFVLVSSGLVYGGQPWEVERIDEDFAGPLRCDEIRSVYAESKRMAEVFAQAAISESKLPVVVVRPFAFVGPYQSLELPWAVTDFIRDCFTGGPIRIMGDGSTVRSLLYASDFAWNVLVAAARGRVRASYNLGSPEPVDLLRLATLITQYFSPAPEILTRVGQSGHEQNRLVPDIRRAERDLDFRVTVPLDEALHKTIQWHRCIQPGRV